MVAFGETELPKYPAAPILHDMNILRSFEISLYALQRTKVRPPSFRNIVKDFPALRTK